MKMQLKSDELIGSEAMQEYTPPLDKLLTMGEPDWRLWREYASLGITSEHVPQLIAMMTDGRLHESGGDSTEVWAPMHAWRALGELRAIEAIEPMISLLPLIDAQDDDAVGEDVPIALSLFGEPAIEPLRRFLSDQSRDEFARVAAAIALRRIGVSSQVLRPLVVKVLVEALERHIGQPHALNAFLVSELIDLRAGSEIAAIERAYRAGCVDLSVCGRLADVRAELGLEAPSPKQRPLFALHDAIDRVIPPRPDEPTPDWMKEFLA
jgi:hypothetical protein